MTTYIKKIIVLLVFTSFSTYGQKSEIKTIHFRYDFSKLLIPEEVYEESERKNITEDQLLVSFILKSDCTMDKFKIVREGKLSAFNECVKNKSDLIFKMFLEQNPCKNFKENILLTFPIKINFSN